MAYINPNPEIKDYKEIINTQESDYTKINEVYFAFIDVLGFKKTFDDIKVNKFVTAEKYRDVFNYYFELMNSSKLMDREKNTGCYAGQTSDTLYFYTSRTDYLLQFIKIFSHFSLYAMTQNVFFRGGIAKGSLFKKEDYQFFGDSVIGAYLLESNISKNPIITVDEKTYNDIKKENDCEKFIKNDEDRHYIKPFALLYEDVVLDIIEGFRRRDFDAKQIEDNIKNNMSIFEYDANNYQKYSFLKKIYEAGNK